MSQGFTLYLDKTKPTITLPAASGFGNYAGATFSVQRAVGSNVVLYQITKPTSVDPANGDVDRYAFQLDAVSGEVSNITIPRQEIHVPTSHPMFDDLKVEYQSLVDTILTYPSTPVQGAMTDTEYIAALEAHAVSCLGVFNTLRSQAGV